MTLHYYITRDENGLLCMHEQEPHRAGNVWKNDGNVYPLNIMLYEDLTWQSEPLKVKIEPDNEIS